MQLELPAPVPVALSSLPVTQCADSPQGASLALEPRTSLGLAGESPPPGWEAVTEGNLGPTNSSAVKFTAIE